MQSVAPSLPTSLDSPGVGPEPGDPPPPFLLITRMLLGHTSVGWGCYHGNDAAIKPRSRYVALIFPGFRETRHTEAISVRGGDGGGCFCISSLLVGSGTAASAPSSEGYISLSIARVVMRRALPGSLHRCRFELMCSVPLKPPAVPGQPFCLPRLFPLHSTKQQLP